VLLFNTIMNDRYTDRGKNKPVCWLVVELAVMSSESVLYEIVRKIDRSWEVLEILILLVKNENSVKGARNLPL